MFLSFILVLLLQITRLNDINTSPSHTLAIKGSNIKNELNKLLEDELKREIAADEILVLNIWQTTCGPCIIEIPDLNKLVSKYQNYNVRFLALSDQERFYLDILLDKRAEFKFDYELSWGNIEAIRQLKSLDKKQNGVAIPIHITVKASGKVENVLLGASPEHIKEIDRFIQSNLKENT